MCNWFMAFVQNIPRFNAPTWDALVCTDMIIIMYELTLRVYKTFDPLKVRFTIAMMPALYNLTYTNTNPIHYIQYV